MKARLAILLVLFLTLGPPVYADSNLDYDTENGHFYTQANGRPLGQSPEGFQISDDGGIPFWRQFRSYGGVQTLGYPISRRFQWDGYTCQATQRGVLQWDATNRQVRLVNVLDYLSVAGRDTFLRDVRLVPRPLDQSVENGLEQPKIVARRMSLLDANRAIKAAYSGPPEPMAFFGLPTSDVTDVGPAYAIRLQRGVIYQWKDGASWAVPGQVSFGNVGDFVKEAGLLPASAVAPEAPPPPRRASLSGRSSGRDLSPVEGVATWYGGYFHGREMNNGEIYDMYDPTTTASNIYPLGTILRVTHKQTKAYVIVRVTDRGAFRYPIVVDLSYAAFRRLDNPGVGVIPVRVEPVR